MHAEQTRVLAVGASCFGFFLMRGTHRDSQRIAGNDDQIGIA